MATTRLGSRSTWHWKVRGVLCLTKEDVVAAGKLKRNHLVDHICVSTDLTRDYEVECWDQFSADGREISDHPGVVARVSVDGR